MKITNQQELYQKLELYKKATQAYYDTGYPIMTDEEFDKLSEELSQFADSHPEIKRALTGIYINGQITAVGNRDVGQQVSLKKIKHHDIRKQFLLFFGGTHSHTKHFYQAPKLDGISIRIVNRREDFSVITRGGLDVTHHLKSNATIISAHKNHNNTDYIVGELLLPKSVFNSKYKNRYANARNTVSGLISSKELTQDEINDLVFIPCTDGTNPLLSETLPNGNLLWKPTTINKLLNKYDDSMSIAANDIYKSYNCEEFDFLCDGVVVSYVTNKRVIENNYPTNMVAVKFESATAETEIVDIEWNVGKSGEYSVRLKLNPVELEGTVVTYATGNNYNFIKENGIGIGAKVLVTKSGDIIPQIKQVLSPSDNIPLPPNSYINDNGKLMTTDTESIKSVRFEKGFNVLMEITGVKGVGPVAISEIGSNIEYNILNLFDPVFRQIVTNNYSGTSFIDKLTPILNIKELRYDQLINILQLPSVGETLSSKVVEILLDENPDLKGVPAKVIEMVVHYKDKLLSLFDKLNNMGYTLTRQSDNSSCLIIEMTGNAPGMTKDQYINCLNSKSPVIKYKQGSLTKNTHCLITDSLSSNSSKMNKARKYNIPIYTYEDFLNNII